MKYQVTVKFRQNFVRVEGNKITVGVRARPIQGKANEELREKIAAHFNVAKSLVSILKGATSKSKIVEIHI